MRFLFTLFHKYLAITKTSAKNKHNNKNAATLPKTPTPSTRAIARGEIHSQDSGRDRRDETDEADDLPPPRLDRVKQRVGAAKGSVYRLRDVYPNEDAARKAATAKRSSLASGERALSLALPVGKPAAAAEAPLSVSGLHPDAEGVA